MIEIIIKAENYFINVVLKKEFSRSLEDWVLADMVVYQVLSSLTHSMR